MQRDSEVPANAVMRDVTIRGRREMIEKVKDAIFDFLLKVGVGV